MTENYQLNELEIDEISLVDHGANEGAKVLLTKRDDIGKRLEKAEIEKAALVEKIALHELEARARGLWPHLAGSDAVKARVLKTLDAFEDEARGELHRFFKAADAALAGSFASKGCEPCGGDEVVDDEGALQRMAGDFAAAHNVSLPVAKKRLVSENKEAAALLRRILASQR